ncbi:GumC family protein [Rubricoccus marinus]|uniref:AAA domain-containing protein n=1 Tax=Rubricoccus marinus TaxID=716817 RepID=A0A259U029_9BACT|nr:polysaccharide biosynthesis tyrosine autokinase [Rubricoccus marinus]OZC03352.1 hypothetical protein BSZ36_10385 [Rubricoccus marinus]
MQDRPTPSPQRPDRSGPASPSSGDVHDAVFEEIVFDPTPMEEWRAPELVEPLPESSGDGAAVPNAERADAPRLAAEPDATAMDYDEREGFRIDSPEAYPATGAAGAALAPIQRSLPAAPQTASGAPPAPPLPPARTEARRAFRDRMQMLSRHKWLILGIFLATLGAFALYTALAPREYTAYSLLLINPDEDAEVSAQEDPNRVLNQALILQENPLIARQTAQAILDEPGAETLSVVREAAAEYEAPVDAANLGEYLQQEIVSVGPAREEVDALKVEAVAHDPREAAKIARVYTNEYLAMTRQSNRADLSETRELLEGQVMTRQGELSEIESQLQAFMTRENAAGLQIQTQNTVSQIGQLESGLDLAQAEISQRSATLAQLEREAASIQPRLAESANTGASNAQSAEVQTEITRYEGLLAQALRANPDLRGDPNAHPDTRALNQRIQGLKAEQRRLAQERASGVVNSNGLDLSSSGSNGASYVADLQRRIADERSALQGARARASSLSSRLGEARGELRAKPGQEVRLSQLERRRAMASEALVELERELAKTEMAEGTELAVASVLREVQEPRKPSSPNVLLNLILGSVLGLLLGLGAAALRYTTDSRIHTPGDLEGAGFTVVGTVPDLTDQLRKGRKTVDGIPVHPGMVTITEAFAPEAEAFRHLHAALNAGAASPQVVLVGAPEAGVGKSLVAANLAAAGAQAGRRVLLIDADLRTPAVGALLGLGESPALGTGGQDLNVVYWSTVVPGLFAVTARETPDAPGQAWAPERVGELLGNLRHTFDLILIDTPPALRTADAALLAPYADAALLVAEAGESDIDAMSHVAGELAGAGLSRVGAVLNRFVPSRAVGHKKTQGARFSTPKARATQQQADPHQKALTA